MAIIRDKDFILQHNTLSLAHQNEDLNAKGEIFAKINNVYIRIGEGNSYPAPTLISLNALEGFCHPSSSLLAPFYEDNSHIVRGSIKLWESKPYYHDWLEIEFNNEMYSFDPSFNILCKKKDYDRIFNTHIVVKIPTEEVHKRLLRYLKSSKDSKVSKQYKNILEYIKDYSEDGYYIQGSKDIYDVFYNTSANIDGTIKRDKILSLNIHLNDNCAKVKEA